MTNNKKKLIIGGTSKGRKWPRIIFVDINTGQKEIVVAQDETSIEFIETEEKVEETRESIKVILIETDNTFESEEIHFEEGQRIVVILKKPSKTDIFVANPEVAKKITVELNKIKANWAPKLWCTGEEQKMVSSIGELSNKKITTRITPIVEKILKDFYGDK